MFDRVPDVCDDVELTGVARGSGLPIDTMQGYIWQVRDGRAVRFRWFRTPDEALKEAGCG